MKYRRISINGERVKYLHEGKGPILLYLHGYGVQPKHLKEMITDLAKDFTVIAPAAFGLNYFKSPPTKVSDYAEFVKEFCHRLKILEYTVVGHSLGGGVAAMLSKIDSKVSKCILINPLFPVDYDCLGFIERAIGCGRKELYFLWRGSYKHLRACTGITGGMKGIKYGFSVFLEMLLNFIKKPAKSFAILNDMAHFKLDAYSMGTKTYLLYGTHDEFFNADRYIDKLPKNIKIKKYSRYSHDWPAFYQLRAAEEIKKCIAESDDEE